VTAFSHAFPRQSHTHPIVALTAAFKVHRSDKGHHAFQFAAAAAAAAHFHGIVELKRRLLAHDDVCVDLVLRAVCGLLLSVRRQLLCWLLLYRTTLVINE